MGFERGAVWVVIEGDYEEAEGEEIGGGGEGVVEDEVGGGIVEGELDVGGKARVERRWKRRVGGGDCEGEGGEFPV